MAEHPEVSVLLQNLTKLTNIPTHHEVKEFPTAKDAAETRRKLGFLVQEVIDVLNNPSASAKLLAPDKSRKISKRHIMAKKDSQFMQKFVQKDLNQPQGTFSTKFAGISSSTGDDSDDNKKLQKSPAPKATEKENDDTEDSVHVGTCSGPKSILKLRTSLDIREQHNELLYTAKGVCFQ